MDLINRELGRYRVLSRLGAGGMGEAYRARDTRLERDVAIKVVAPRLLEDEAARHRLRREALSLSRLNHPSIATVHDFDTADGIDFLVMELIDGEPLAARIARGALPLDEALTYAREIAGALAAAHLAGVIHRDLKPANVMIDRSKRPVVMDFGIAKFVGKPSSLTQQGAIIGTPAYMPPEQADEDAGKVGPHSDVYSLGAILYTLLTGKLPFDAGSALHTLMKVVSAEPP